MQAHQNAIISVIKSNTKVIDIGCGEGELLRALQEKNVSGHGFDIESQKVSTAVASGLSAIQGDADTDLQHYPENGFDYAILALSLQSMKEPKHVLEEALRIGKQVVVAIPNFGHFKNRYAFVTNGCMPVTDKLSFQWYETPNIHFCTIKDFVIFAQHLGCDIQTRLSVNAAGATKPFSGNGAFGANLFAHYGVFVLTKD